MPHILCGSALVPLVKWAADAAGDHRPPPHAGCLAARAGCRGVSGRPGLGRLPIWSYNGRHLLRRSPARPGGERCPPGARTLLLAAPRRGSSTRKSGRPSCSRTVHERAARNLRPGRSPANAPGDHPVDSAAQPRAPGSAAHSRVSDLSRPRSPVAHTSTSLPRRSRAIPRSALTPSAGSPSAKGSTMRLTLLLCALLTSACASARPARPVALDPSHPAAPESAPLSITPLAKQPPGRPPEKGPPR
jgi:hypothetical protein